MIDLYTWSTPNGHKASIALEELELPYRAIAVDICAGQQFEPAFLAVSPNNKIPAIADRPAVQRGLAVPGTASEDATLTEAAREFLFGATQYRRHR